MNFLFLLAQAPPNQNPFGHTFILLGLMIVMMYFLIIRPQSKQRKQQAAMIAALKKGDQVITAGGIHAIVHHLSEKTATLKLSEGVFVPFEKSSIQTVKKAAATKNGKAETDAEVVAEK